MGTPVRHEAQASVLAETARLRGVKSPDSRLEALRPRPSPPGAFSCLRRERLRHWPFVSPQCPTSQPRGRFAGHSQPHCAPVQPAGDPDPPLSGCRAPFCNLCKEYFEKFSDRVASTPPQSASEKNLEPQGHHIPPACRCVLDQRNLMIAQLRILGVALLKWASGSCSPHSTKT